jgi:Flp pilus assembly protein TadG
MPGFHEQPGRRNDVKMFRDERGQATTFMALFMGLIMLGFIAFALDVGYLFQKKRMAQAAADAAAIAAAEEGATTANGQNAANVAAKLNGFDTTLGTNPATVTLSTLSTGNYSSTQAVPTNWVTAVVSQPINTFFLEAFNKTMSTVTVSASSVAAGGLNSSACLCLKGTSGTDLSMSNGAKFTGSNCAISENSSSSNAITVIGGANLCAQAIGTVAAWNGASNGPNVNNGGVVCATAALVPGVAACAPAMPNVPVDATCSADPYSLIVGGGKSYTVGPGSTYGTTKSSANGNMVCYNGLTLDGNSDIATLNPGIYVINGGVGLHFMSGGPNLGGNGVLFYLTNGAMLTIDQGANMNLVAGGNTKSGGGSAPSTGIYNGILFYQDPGYPAAANDATSDAGDSAGISIQGGTNIYINGEILAPLAAVTVGNGSGTTINTNILAKTLNMYGGGTLTNTATTNLGSVSAGGASYLTQ